MFQPKVVQKIKTHFVFNNISLKLLHRTNVQKYGTAIQAKDMHCRLDK